MTDNNEIIFDSPPSEPDDDFWLEQGRKLVEDSIPAVQDAAKSLMTGLGLLKGVYLAIIGFADFIPKAFPMTQKYLFILPLIFWLAGLFLSIRVMMTRRMSIFMHSPSDIREKIGQIIEDKQKKLQWAFWMTAIGVIAALWLLVFRMGF